ncbi:DNA polymerase III subunit gamma and tau [Ancrocorticia sp.]|uniref:DNA polymerase III subunit gamma and tau n=1 Tax=Ancrocorticia sp. TaxID=2593684 RepID=UPI003F93A42A
MALYRRYRPQKFQDVIGQEQVTKPLMAALRAGKTAHAYLFSGPRGCGKTTSARILARCLNCEQAPTDTPCGECESCRELAAEGSGSLDVVEMDAASHGGVDDARDLIERASFAPARDRYKIFIIDEAHMVSNQGFNALLKLVEEPPPHIKFIFATTEPEKVIGTIRSRTHHYPFRLVPPDELESYLGQICGEEGVQVGAGVLPLVVRAGGGSVRDSLSVLDQLIGGSESDSLAYEAAIGLLGFTDGSLLDDAVEALAARDGATLFAVIDRVVQSGHDPRRFVEDLLQRLRDIVVIALAGESAHDVLVSVPDDQYERMVQQAGHLGAARSSYSADLVNDALSQMVGATSPRLQLELLCARLLLPPQRADGQAPAQAASSGHGDSVQPSPARNKPAERPVRPASATREQKAPAGPGNPSVPGRQIRPEWAAPEAAPATEQAARSDRAGSASPARARAEQSEATPAEQPGKVQAATPETVPDTRPKSPQTSRPDQSVETQPAQSEAASRSQTNQPVDDQSAQPEGLETPRPEQPAEAPAIPQDSGDVSIIRQRWKEIVAEVQAHSKSTAALIQTNAQVGSLEGGVLTLLFQTQGLATTFNSRGHAPRVQSALHDVLGIDATVEAASGGDGAGPKARAVAAAGPSNSPTVLATGALTDTATNLGKNSPNVPAISSDEPARDQEHQIQQLRPEPAEVAEQPTPVAKEPAQPTPVTKEAAQPTPVAKEAEHRQAGPADPAGVLALLLDSPENNGSAEPQEVQSTPVSAAESQRGPSLDTNTGYDAAPAETDGPAGPERETMSVAVTDPAPEDGGTPYFPPEPEPEPWLDEPEASSSAAMADHEAMQVSEPARPLGQSPTSRSEEPADRTGQASPHVSASEGNGSLGSTSDVNGARGHSPDTSDVPFYAQQMPTPRRPEDIDPGGSLPAGSRASSATSTAQTPSAPSTAQTPRGSSYSQAPSGPSSAQAPGAPSSTQAPSAPSPSFALPSKPRPQSAGGPSSNRSVSDRIREMHGGSSSSPADPGPFASQGGRGLGYGATDRGYAGSADSHEDADDDGVSPDDPTIAQSNLVGIEVVLNTFKGTVIDEKTGNGE